MQVRSAFKCMNYNWTECGMRGEQGRLLYTINCGGVLLRINCCGMGCVFVGWDVCLWVVCLWVVCLWVDCGSVVWVCGVGLWCGLKSLCMDCVELLVGIYSREIYFCCMFHDSMQVTNKIQTLE
jgi:hypothetical protein